MPSILMLDDEVHVLSALRRLLRRALGDDTTIETFTDPHDAIARIGEHAFDVIVSDFRMPAMDGIQFLRFARELQPNALRLIVSASTEIGGVMTAINDIGVFRYVVKPWVPELLIDDLRCALAQAESAREQRRLADSMLVQTGALGPAEAERRRLEELEPGITDVQWGDHGEVLMPPLSSRAG